MDDGFEAFTEGKEYPVVSLKEGGNGPGLVLKNNEPWLHGMTWDLLRQHFNVMKVYVCGPITGLPNMNREAFASAAKQLQDLGHQPVNPHETCATIVQEHTGTSDELWQKCMRADIRELMTCDCLVLLPGWHESKGAKLELELAMRLGIPHAKFHEFEYTLGI